MASTLGVSTMARDMLAQPCPLSGEITHHALRAEGWTDESGPPLVSRVQVVIHERAFAILAIPASMDLASPMS